MKNTEIYSYSEMVSELKDNEYVLFGFFGHKGNECISDGNVQKRIKQNLIGAENIKAFIKVDGGFVSEFCYSLGFRSIEGE